jgi:hypothetical protein
MGASAAERGRNTPDHAAVSVPPRRGRVIASYREWAQDNPCPHIGIAGREESKTAFRRRAPATYL